MSEIQRIGIIGDGQLGRMLVEDGLRYDPDLSFTVLGAAGPDSPAAQVGARQLDGGLKDPEAIRRLVEHSDVTTWEIEHIDAQTLVELEAEGHNIQPSPRSLLTIQDKLTQKQHLTNHGIAVAPFAVLRDATDLHDIRNIFGGEVMVKARRGGYDGRGNRVLRANESWHDVEQAFPEAASDTLYAEQMIPFKREVALVGARDMSGRIVTYRAVETIHKNNICHTVIADLNKKRLREAEALGRTTIESFAGAGVFAVEMFEDKDGEFKVNEVAPRVHNSGHLTDLGAEVSQFEQHIRAIIGAPLGSTRSIGSAVMINILGTKDGVFKEYMHGIQGYEAAGSLAHVRWYGKAPRPGTERKIGHITAVDTNIIRAMARAEWLQSTIN